ncbi:MAG: hypothetical protein WC966_12000 [Bradymonadales bacterium]|jgi:hypothetical protein
MRWTRREILALGVGTVASLALGLVGIRWGFKRASLRFEEARSIPGEALHLHIEKLENARDLRVVLRRVDSGSSHIVEDLGAAVLGTHSVVTPYCKVEGESYELVASLLNARGKELQRSEPVEVLVRPFCFGM